MTDNQLTSYQKSEIRRMRREGWTIGAVTHYADSDNPWATIEISKGNYRTKAGFPATKALERHFMNAR